MARRRWRPSGFWIGAGLGLCLAFHGCSGATDAESGASGGLGGATGNSHSGGSHSGGAGAGGSHGRQTGGGSGEGGSGCPTTPTEGRCPAGCNEVLAYAVDVDGACVEDDGAPDVVACLGETLCGQAPGCAVRRADGVTFFNPTDLCLLEPELEGAWAACPDELELALQAAPGCEGGAGGGG